MKSKALLRLAEGCAPVSDSGSLLTRIWNRGTSPCFAKTFCLNAAYICSLHIFARIGPIIAEFLGQAILRGRKTRRPVTRFWGQVSNLLTQGLGHKYLFTFVGSSF